jgi:hypothetical protein
MTAAS